MRLLGPLISDNQGRLHQLGLTVGDVISDLAEAISQGVMAERIGRILDANTKFARNFGTGITNLIQVFVVLLDHLRPVTTAIGEMVWQFSEWALAAINAASASGALDAWINTVWTSATRMVGALWDFAVGIKNVFAAATGVSQSMFGTFEETARKFREWTGDAANQDRMTRFFERMYVISSRVNQIIGRLARSMLLALEGTDTDSVLRGFDNLEAAVRPIAQIFESIRGAAGPELTRMFENLATVVQQLADSGVFGIIAGALANLFAIISTVLAIPGVGPLLAFAAGLAMIAKTVSFVLAIIRPLLGIFNILRIVLIAVAGVVGWIPIVIAGLVAALIWFFTQTKVGQAIVQAVWDAIKTAISAAVDWIVGAWNWMVSAFQTAVAWVVSLAQSIWSTVSTAFGAVRDFVVAVMSAIGTGIQVALGVILTIWSYIWPLLLLPVRIVYGVVLAILGMLWTGIQVIFQGIWTVITTVWNAIWGFIQPILQGIANFIRGVWNGIRNAISGAMNAIWGVISGVWNVITGWLSLQMARIRQTVRDAWDGVTNAIRGALNAAWGVVQNVWNRITGFVQGALDRLRGLAQGAWNALGNLGSGVLGGLKRAVNVVIDAVNTVIGGINWAIGAANNLPGPDIPTIPRIPRLARGGTVSPTGGGTLAMIGEAGRPERVEPLDPTGLSKRDRAMINLLSGGGNAPNVRVYIGERELTEIVDVVVEDRETGLADRVLTGTKG
jgi:phage-related protein